MWQMLKSGCVGSSQTVAIHDPFYINKKKKKKH